jgi:hypothetical protein
MTAAHDLNDSMIRFQRSEIHDGIKPEVTETNGMYNAGLIENVSLISRGEALGHDMWIDRETLQQVMSQGEEKGSVKVRFTHPTMCSDGLGRALGRVTNFRLFNDKVVGDLHFFESAHNTPEGNLAEYVMLLVDEDPTSAGLSIVFQADLDQQDSFYQQYTSNGVFTSPDPENTKGYQHVRLSELRAADVVDEPAANPSGMFHREDLRSQADALLSYAVGLSDNKPSSVLGIDPDRATAFIQRWMSENNFQLQNPTESDMSSENTEDQTPVDTRETVLEELNMFTAEFGVENGTLWFQENLTVAEAFEREARMLREANQTLLAQVADLQEQLSQVQVGEVDPIDVIDSTSDEKVQYTSFFNIKNAANN